MICNIRGNDNFNIIILIFIKKLGFLQGSLPDKDVFLSE